MSDLTSDQKAAAMADAFKPLADAAHEMRTTLPCSAVDGKPFFRVEIDQDNTTYGYLMLGIYAVHYNEVSWLEPIAHALRSHDGLIARITELETALRAITRNQSEKKGEEGICPFGCDAPWIAMSALGEWKDEKIAAWKP